MGTSLIMKFLKVNPLFFCSSFLLGTALVIAPTMAFAQHGGGGHGAPIGGGGLSGSNGRPDGPGEKDTLKDFHHAMEVQATTDQAAAFRAILKNTEAANTQLASLGQEKDAAQWAGRAAEVRAAIEKARIATRNFVDGLSARQKSGLKEITGKIGKAESDLAGQEKALEANAGEGKHDEVGSGRTEGLAKALENFRSHQSRLAVEMGIIVTDDAQVVFRIPAFKTSAEMGEQRIAVSAAAVISRVGTGDEANVYKIALTQDLSDLQPNITEALRAQVESFPRCGERVELRNATLALAAPASVVVAQLYVERWICSRGPVTARELAQGSGSAEVRMTPAVGANGELTMQTELGRIEGDKFVEELLRSGALGESLREKIAASMVKVIESANFKAMLPPAVGAAKIEGARFESTAGDNLGLALDGEMRMSNEQAALLGNQLKERVAAQAAK